MQKMLYKMETTPRIQTAFRLRQDVLSGVKREAKRRGMSVNAYVEQTLERETRIEWPKLPKNFTASQEILDLQIIHDWVDPTPEELEEDPRMASILGL